METSNSTVILSPGSGTELRDLLAPLPVECLFDAFHQHRPFFRKGNPERYSQLLSLDEYDRTLDAFSRGQRDTTFEVSAAFSSRGETARALRMVTIQPWQHREVMRGGTSVRTMNFEQVHSKSAQLLAALKTQLGYLGDATVASVRSPDGQGYPLHWDGVFVLSLQISGRKTWRYAPAPALPWPPTAAVQGPDGEPRWTGKFAHDRPLPPTRHFAPSDYREVTLEPGDLLALPAGVWHEAHAHGDSLALSLGFHPFSFSSLLLTLFESQFELDPSWYAIPPLLTGPQASEPMAQTSRAYLAARLQEASERIRHLEAGSLEVLHSVAGNIVELASEISQRAGGTDAATLSSTQAPGAELGEEDEIGFREDEYAYVYQPNHEAGLFLFVGMQRVDLPRDAAPLAELLTTHRRWRVGDAMAALQGRMNERVARRYLSALVARSLLVRLPRTGSM